MALYLDASVMVALLGAEAGSDAAREFVSRAAEPRLVSEFAAAEVASTLSRLVRMKLRTEVAARAVLDYFDRWRLSETLAISIDNSDIAEASEIVRRFELKLRTPDALHLAVSRRVGAKLATQDMRLADAGVALGVAVVRL